MRIASAGHGLFAALMIGLGVQGAITGRFTTVWQPVPAGVPGREALVYCCAALSFVTGIGLLFPRSAAPAARMLLAALVLWLLTLRIAGAVQLPLLDGSWSLADTMAMTAAVWVLFVWFATQWDQRHLRFATADSGLRIGRMLYGLALMPFGYAHFANLSGTATLVPGWLPWRVAWAASTGVAFVAAGIAIVADVCAPIGAALSALQMGLFGALVWIPVLLSGRATAFHRLEFATTVALAIAGAVVAEGLAARRPRARDAHVSSDDWRATVTADRSDLKVVLFAWLVAGTLDVTAAVTYYPLVAGARAVRILQGIASGVLGPTAYDGGAATAALGLGLHYLIALIWTVVFLLAARRFKALTRYPVLVGLSYGVVVWAVMNLIVVPLSNARRAPFDPAQAAIAALILMLCIGLPIAVIVARSSRPIAQRPPATMTRA